MTIIFSKRDDTLFLRNIWKGLDNVKVVEVESSDDYEEVEKSLLVEKDIVIFCGHGSSNGLLYPNFEGEIIHQDNLELYKDKTIIGIWCYASDFALKYNLHGFFSSMFISDVDEAYDNNCYNQLEDIDKENILFSKRLNRLLKYKIDINQWSELLEKEADYEIDFVKFNYDGLIKL